MSGGRPPCAGHRQYRSGLRHAEVVALDLEHVDREHGTITVCGKGTRSGSATSPVVGWRHARLAADARRSTGAAVLTRAPVTPNGVAAPADGAGPARAHAPAGAVGPGAMATPELGRESVLAHWMVVQDLARPVRKAVHCGLSACAEQPPRARPDSARSVAEKTGPTPGPLCSRWSWTRQLGLSGARAVLLTRRASPRAVHSAG